MKPARNPVTSLDEARLDKLLAELAGLDKRRAELAEQIAGVCRTWSMANGYRVHLDAVQTKRAMASQINQGE